MRPSTFMDFQKLDGWQRAVDLAVECYRVTDLLPPHERYGLASQIRRAAISVPANIAEGKGRGSQRELARFLTIARGSLMELETHLIIAQRLNYLTATDLTAFVALRAHVGRLLNGLIRHLHATAANR
jgi:four helix bundle protein